MLEIGRKSANLILKSQNLTRCTNYNSSQNILKRKVNVAIQNLVKKRFQNMDAQIKLLNKIIGTANILILQQGLVYMEVG